MYSLLICLKVDLKTQGIESNWFIIVEIKGISPLHNLMPVIADKWMPISQLNPTKQVVCTATDPKG